MRQNRRMKSGTRALLGVIAILTSLFMAAPAVAADPLTITVIVVDADVDGVAVTFTAAGLKRGDEVDVVTLTYTGVDNGYGPSSEPPSKVGKYRVQPSAAVFAKGSASNYDISYVGANFSIVIEQQTPLPKVDVVTESPTRKPTPRATSTTPKPTATPTAAASTATTPKQNGSEPPADVPSPIASPSESAMPILTAAPTASEVPADTTGESSTPAPPYSLAANAESAVNAQVALYTLLATTGAAAHLHTRRRRERDEDEDERAELAGVKAGSLSQTRDAQGWGDRSVTWRLPFTQQFDTAFKTLALRLGRLSPLLARTAMDASYLRAILGSGTVLLYPLGITLALSALGSNVESPIVPATAALAALAIVGVIDAAAGLVASVVYLGALLATGHLVSLHDWLGALGVALLWFAPALLASAFRPFRRIVDSAAAAWERGTDYLLTLLLTYWAISSMVTALPALADQQLSITGDADTLGLVLTAAVGLRMLLEDVAFYLYPERLKAQGVVTPTPTLQSRFIAIALRTALFAIVAFPFTGADITLWLATAMFAFPLLLQFVDPKLPELSALGRLLPRATARTVVMAVLGTLFAAWLRQYFEDPANWAAWSFVLLGVPGLLLSLLDAVSGMPQPRRWFLTPLGTLAYRVGGMLMFVLLWQIQRGVDLLDWLFG